MRGALILISGALVAAPGVFPSPVQSVAQISAVAVLAWVAYTQHLELREIRKSNQAIIDKLCERWDKWEERRHGDSSRLDDTLLRFAAQCERRSQHKDNSQ